jgi:uncharacterized protein (TIGR03435 family)
MDLRQILRTVVTAAFAIATAVSAERPAFDVASIHLNRSDTRDSSIGRSGGRIYVRNVSLREVIAFAYGIPTDRDDKLTGPAWLASEKFDIEAVCPPETSRERVTQMMQTLLEERFALRTHREDRKLNGYALVKTKRTPRLHPSLGVDQSLDASFTFSEGRVTGRAMSMQALANRLSGPVFKLGSPVVDETGIQGVYDFTLAWSPDAAPAAAESAPSIFTAIQEQLSLKLEPRKIMVSTLVVDRIERIPAGN